jgi:hypothetical protein
MSVSMIDGLEQAAYRGFARPFAGPETTRSWPPCAVRCTARTPEHSVRDGYPPQGESLSNILAVMKRILSTLRWLALPFLVIPAACHSKTSNPDEVKRDVAEKLAKWVGATDAAVIGAPSATASARAQRAKPGAVPASIWVGESGGVRIEWTTQGIAARRPDGTAIDLFDRSQGESGCEGDQTLRLLSVVGSIVSYEESEGTTCEGAAHPSAITLYAAVDAAHPGKKVRLTDLFPDADVLRALVADSVVKRHLPKTLPKTTDALVEALADSEQECEYAFGKDLLTRFAFHHVEGDRVAVRIGLSHGCEVARGKLTQLGLLLPIPPTWKGPLDRASSRAEGFLMRDQEAVSGGRETTIHF